MRLKSLPSLRGKKRYVIFRIHSESPLNYPNVRDAILDSLANWLGQNEMAKAKIRMETKNNITKEYKSLFIT